MVWLMEGESREKQERNWKKREFEDFWGSVEGVIEGSWRRLRDFWWLLGVVADREV